MNADPDPSPTAFVLDAVREVFERRIPFNRILGLSVESLDDEHPRISFERRDELIGSFVRGALHGGVISAVLDVTGGLTAYLGVLRKKQYSTAEQALAQFGKLSTIDLRVDYLRPAIGERYYTTGYMLRTGARVAVTRMELHDAQDRLLAVGTGAYMVD